MLTVQEISKKAGVSKALTYKSIHAGQIPYQMVGPVYLLSSSAITQMKQIKQLAVAARQEKAQAGVIKWRAQQKMMLTKQKKIDCSPETKIEQHQPQDDPAVILVAETIKNVLTEILSRIKSLEDSSDQNTASLIKAVNSVAMPVSADRRLERDHWATISTHQSALAKNVQECREILVRLGDMWK